MPRALDALLTELIDYAGLFPPAELGLADVVHNYDQYWRGPQRWMLGRLIVPASRLAEFEQVYAQVASPPSAADPWRLSVLVPAAGETAAWEAALDQISEYQAHRAKSATPGPVIDTLEGKAHQAAEVDAAAVLVDRGLQVFLELPWGTAAHPLLAAIAAHQRPGLRAKLRTGGVTPPAIPSPELVADFITAAAANGVGFKATAGLHHPLRACQRLTYRADAPTAVMHGFLNVFVAAVLAADGTVPQTTLEQILSEQDSSAFCFDDLGLAWRGQRASLAAIQTTRRRFAYAFGSCSFTEPVEDLQVLGWGK